MKKLCHLLLALLFFLAPHASRLPSTLLGTGAALAATGCSYPTSHDSYLDKSTGDFLTVADVNSRSCAIEKLESGPLRPLDGSAGAPAYSFLNDSDTGFFRQASGTVDYVSNNNALIRFGTTGLDVTGSGTIRATTAPSGFGSIGQVSQNNSGTPNTQFDLDADVVILRNSANDTVVRYNPGAAITNNVSTAGPAANGRDQAGAFSASSWIHFYWIWNPSTSTLATLSSAVAPPTGPTLPSGYTHWSYAGAVRFNASSQLISSDIRGNRVTYRTHLAALSGGAATTETAVSLTSLVPPNALHISIFGHLRHGASTTVAGEIGGEIRYASGAIWTNLVIRAAGAGVQQADTQRMEIPNNAQQVFYRLSGSDGGPALDLFVGGYTVPNGGL